MLIIGWIHWPCMFGDDPCTVSWRRHYPINRNATRGKGLYEPSSEKESPKTTRRRNLLPRAKFLTACPSNSTSTERGAAAAEIANVSTKASLLGVAIMIVAGVEQADEVVRQAARCRRRVGIRTLWRRVLLIVSQQLPLCGNETREGCSIGIGTLGIDAVKHDDGHAVAF